MRRLYAAILLTWIFAVGCNRGGDPKGVGKVAPKFVVSDGVHTADLNGLRGRVVLLNFLRRGARPASTNAQAHHYCYELGRRRVGLSPLTELEFCDVSL